MDARTVFVTVAIVAVIWHVVSSLMICSRLATRGVKINWIFIRMLYPVYAGKYRKMVKSETGHEPPLFYHWVVSVNVALVAAIAAIAIAA